MIDNLPPGDYTYQVQAQGVFGQYSEEGARGTFTIQLPYFRQPAFYLPILAFVSIAAGIGLVLNKRKRGIAHARIDSGAKFHTIAEATNSAIILYTEKFILYANQKAELLTGYSAGELEYLSFYDLFLPKDHQHIRDLGASSKIISPFECMLLARSSGSKWIELSNRSITIHGRTVMMGTLNDITPRIKAETTLRESEIRFQQMFSLAPVAMLHIDTKGFCRSINNRWSELTRQSATEAIGVGWADMLHPEDRQAVLTAWYRAIADASPFTREFRLRTATGTAHWVSAASIPLTDGSESLAGSLVMFSDITDRKNAERILSEYQDRIQSLTKELSSIEERERRRMATYLHDCVGQSLAFCRMKLQEIQDAERFNGATESLNQIQSMLEQSIRDTRSLTYELSPPVLHEIGLHQAVEMLIEHMNSISQTRFTLTSTSTSDTLTYEQRTTLYQAVRELMRNVVKHAHARHATVSLECRSGNYSVTVDDDGSGFNTADLAGHNGSGGGFGLRSLRERMSYVGGTLRIESSPHQGSRMSASLPLFQ
jgi:PAS domain S-box-containing protein